MKKLTALLIALLLVSSAAVGCGAPSGTQTRSPSNAASETPGEQTAPASGEQTAPASGEPSASVTASPEETDIKLFDYDVSEYVEIPDLSTLRITRSEVEEKAKEYYEELLEDYPIISDKTEGTVEEGDTTYIYFKGTLIVVDDDVFLDLGATGIPALDALTGDSIPEDSPVAYDLTLPDDFTLPPFIVREDGQLEKELKGANVRVILTAVGGDAVKGTVSKVHVRLEYVFSGGTYDESRSDTGFELTIGSNNFIPGFESGMIGMPVEKGSTRILSIAFPVPYSSNPAFSGEKVDFEVRIVSVKSTSYFDLDDPDALAAFKEEYLADNPGESFDYKNKAELMAEYGSRAIATIAYNMIIDGVKIIKTNEKEMAEYREVIKEQLIRSCSNYVYSYIGRMLTEEEVIGYFFNGSKEDFDAEVEESAIDFLGRHLTFFGIARQVGIKEASEDDINAYLAGKVEYYKGLGYTVTKEDLMDLVYGGRAEIIKEMLINDLLDYLAKNVRVVEDE